ncbi:MAG: SdiA-regulated domain-containing protein [Candidatus Gracilibacteria bacterium]
MDFVKKISSFALLTALLLAPLQGALASAVSTPWPSSDSTGVDISAAIHALYSDFDPSGIAWHKGRGTYIVVDNISGIVVELEEDGTIVNSWDAGAYDLEGVTIVDNYDSNIIYLADETSSTAIGFDLETGVITDEVFSFADHVYASSGLGLEGLEWIPDGVHAYGVTPLGGLFYAGWQVDGDIFVFEPSGTNTSTYLEEIHTTSGYSDLSALDYDEDSGILFTIYDGLDTLEERAPTGELLASYQLPGYNQEGINVRSDCSEGVAKVAIAEDSGRIMLYEDYPISCPVIDDDDDGVEYALDCDDDDASISEMQTYYRDADSDGYGDASVTAEVCSMTVPAGYVTNADDLYDNARIEILGDARDNDGDSDLDEDDTLAENGLHPLYSVMDPKREYPIEEISASSGKLLVRYSDNSRYAYKTSVFSIGATSCSAAAVSSTSYILVHCSFGYVLMNGLTGEKIAKNFFKGTFAANRWAILKVGTLG